MKVKLSYTVATEDVLEEAAFLVANTGPRLNSCVQLFNSVVNNLRDEEFNLGGFRAHLDELRENLSKIDTRLMEVNEIVQGYEEYHEHQRHPVRVAEEPELPEPVPASPGVEMTEVEE